MLWVGWGTRTTWELFVGLKLILWPSQTGLDISWASMKNICFLSAQTQLEIVETQSWTAVTGLWAFLPATPPPSPPPLDMKSRSCFVFFFVFFSEMSIWYVVYNTSKHMNKCEHMLCRNWGCCVNCPRSFFSFWSFLHRVFNICLFNINKNTEHFNTHFWFL